MIPNITHDKGNFCLDGKPINTTQVYSIIEDLIRDNARLHKQSAKDKRTIRALLEDSDNGINSPI